MGAILDTRAMLPFAEGVDGDVVTGGEPSQGTGRLLDFLADGLRGAGLLVQFADHFDWALSVARSLSKPSRARVSSQMRLLR
ncbi:hypothetical protein [Laribacter hongkongensis]|uniref:hypothetical protein n=1 Tax=Laribacter hongkongensis TaxID=168471 RepID=UPI001EFDA4AC|nr:hypothetical protein [Laribacter hongkongensis]MCG9080576.1 hypothetical protein [Laribacter hongkongensis]